MLQIIFLFLCSELIIITVNFILKLPLSLSVLILMNYIFYKEHALVDALKVFSHF